MKTAQFHTSTAYFRAMGLLLGLAMFAGCTIHPTPGENKEAAAMVKTARDFDKATAEQLQALTGKIPYQVHGKLRRTEHEAAKEQDGKDKGYVKAELIEATAPVCINCYFALDQNDAVCALKVDQELTIRGQLHSVSKDSVTLVGCCLVADGEK